MESYTGVREEEEGLGVLPKNKLQNIRLGEQKRQGRVQRVGRRGRLHGISYLYLPSVRVEGPCMGAGTSPNVAGHSFDF